MSTGRPIEIYDILTHVFGVVCLRTLRPRKNHGTTGDFGAGLCTVIIDWRIC